MYMGVDLKVLWVDFLWFLQAYKGKYGVFPIRVMA